MISELKEDALELLKNLIATQSFSKEEDETALLIMQWLSSHDVKFESSQHNIWAKNKFFDSSKPTILLNSHHDTVKPNKGYTKDPFQAEIIDGKLYGLGSNDAGGSLVSLMALFSYYYKHKNLKYNLLLLASAEEENSGDGGIRSVVPTLPIINFAQVLIALITFANPKKNSFPSFKSEIETNSSKDAPAQNALSPSLFNIIT